MITDIQGCLKMTLPPSAKVDGEVVRESTTAVLNPTDICIVGNFEEEETDAVAALAVAGKAAKNDGTAASESDSSGAEVPATSDSVHESTTESDMDAANDKASAAPPPNMATGARMTGTATGTTRAAALAAAVEARGLVKRNARERHSREGSSSAFAGVCWHKYNRKWVAQICISGQTTPLGMFEATAGPGPPGAVKRP